MIAVKGHYLVLTNETDTILGKMELLEAQRLEPPVDESKCSAGVETVQYPCSSYLVANFNLLKFSTKKLLIKVIKYFKLIFSCFLFLVNILLNDYLTEL